MAHSLRWKLRMWLRWHPWRNNIEKALYILVVLIYWRPKKQVDNGTDRHDSGLHSYRRDA